MNDEWSIKSIKLWQDGTWDALLVSMDRGGQIKNQVFDRVTSTDRFHWFTRDRRPAVDAVQVKLTVMAGEMDAQGMRVVIF